MITFKQFISEEDIRHDNVIDAAKVFLTHCKQWKDIDNPLYRLSDSHVGGEPHVMRTRSPRDRLVDSHGETAALQNLIFKQKGWENYPSRKRSIFCSTTKSFEIGDIDITYENLLIIFPFDNVDIAITTAADFNFIMLPMREGGKADKAVMEYAKWIDSWCKEITNRKTFDPELSINRLKQYLIDDEGKFNPSEDADMRFIDDNFKSQLEFICFELPEYFTPEHLGCRLVNSSSIDLPGKTRECWFSGKYLSIPYREYKQFKEAVKSLQGQEK